MSSSSIKGNTSRLAIHYPHIITEERRSKSVIANNTMANLDSRQRKMKDVIEIIGAGISALLAYKYYLSKGFDPIVFELESSIGFNNKMLSLSDEGNDDSSLSGECNLWGDTFSSEEKWNVTIQDTGTLST
ncbi:hypothetical protein FXO37_21237 [Capsicum annuum]|nr:hypothetical protein FXO37_21237 [Capsicum annuum]